MPYFRVRQAVTMLMIGSEDQAARFLHAISSIGMLRAEEFPEECRGVFLDIKGSMSNLSERGEAGEYRRRLLGKKLLKLFLYLHERLSADDSFRTSAESLASDKD